MRTKTRIKGADLDRSTLVQNLAHELRNPLTNVRLAFDQLVADLPETNDQNKAYIDLIRRNLGKVDHLVLSLLQSFSDVYLRKSEVSIQEVVQMAISNITDRAALKGIDLAFTSGEASMIISADQEQVELAITNVLLNAVEACESGTGKVQITLNKDLEHRAVLTIADNGPGLTDPSAIFDAFNSSKQGGLGLGLTVTRKIIDAHNGVISAANVPHGGAVFSISLPCITC